MKALEMEDDSEDHVELDSFLGNNKNGSSNGHHIVGRSKKTVGVGGAKGSPPSYRSYAYVGMVALIMLFMYTLLAPPEDGLDEDDIKHDHTPTTTDSAATPPATVPKTPEISPTAPSSTTTRYYSQLATIVPDPEHILSEADQTAWKERVHGSWLFFDGHETERPQSDYCGLYDYRDVPAEDFPDESWQTDAVYVNHILDAGDKLLTRVMEAIFTEYGHGLPLSPDQLAERLRMFSWDRLDLSDPNVGPPQQFTKRGDQGNGGWTTARSFAGLVRRLLHAILTNDEFVIVLGGHSAAAGHGNHFHQSYMMSAFRILYPVFARLGVKLRVRNMAQGGIGTTHSALAGGSIYGDDVDILIWDSGMTEPGPAEQEFFIRQGLLAGARKVPLIWAQNFEVLKLLHERADVDVGRLGLGMWGVPEVTSPTQATEVPYAARFLKCSHDASLYCGEQPRFCAICWQNRSDIPDPLQLFDAIKPQPGSQVKWHPGWRAHKLQGRVIAYTILDALQTALSTYMSQTMGGQPLDDEFWHVKDYYRNIRTKLLNLPPEVGYCKDLAGRMPERLCRTPMHGATLYTPRVNPHEASLLALLKPAPNGYVPRNTQKVMYDGPDVHNACYDVPPDEMDPDAVAGLRRRRHLHEWYEAVSARPVRNATATRTLSGIVPGVGWEVGGEKPGYCDGEYFSICGRERTNDCPMNAHQDSRGYIVGNEYSGWLVLNIPAIQNGIIMLKFFSWLGPEASTMTQGWNTVNNERRLRSENITRLDDAYEVYDSIGTNRRLGMDDWPDTFTFEYAINGKITTLNKQQFVDMRREVERVLEVWTILDDPQFSGTDVEVAFRITNCGRKCVLAFTHVYWS